MTGLRCLSGISFWILGFVVWNLFRISDLVLQPFVPCGASKGGQGLKNFRSFRIWDSRARLDSLNYATDGFTKHNPHDLRRRNRGGLDHTPCPDLAQNRNGFVLTESYGQSNGDSCPSLCVVVAAKDEEANIGPCVQSLLMQDYPNFNVILCNDRSKDRTGEIVSQIAAGDSRMRAVMNIQELPDGWCGKNNAMQNGIAASQSEYVCMIDADCRQISSRTLSVAMRYARDNGADLLSILPVMEMPTFWESIIQPVCSGVMMIWFHPDRVNDPQKPQAYANGTFMLIKRSAYEQIGTHEAVKDRVNEDMHMANLIKRKGLRLMVVRGPGALRDANVRRSEVHDSRLEPDILRHVRHAPSPHCVACGLGGDGPAAIPYRPCEPDALGTKCHRRRPLRRQLVARLHHRQRPPPVSSRSA